MDPVGKESEGGLCVSPNTQDCRLEGRTQAPGSGRRPGAESASPFLTFRSDDVQARRGGWCPGVGGSQPGTARGPPASSAGGRGPLLARAFPWGHCVTAQDMLPAQPGLCGPPRHCRLAALWSSLTGGAAPSQNSLALLGQGEEGFIPSCEVAESRAWGPGLSPPAGTRASGLSR